MKTLAAHFKQQVHAKIKDTQWFRTAPPELQKAARITVLGVELHRYTSAFGMAGGDRPTLVAECLCGAETQRFSWLLTDLDDARYES